ncbi:MAG: TlpA disulfide reductase family protein [Chitinophagaceae bacterium]|nr:TlpA disulfide reductase family protein [Chitinophagaceae bacterium]
MRRLLTIIALLGLLAACKQKTTHTYTVEGKIANLNAQKVYLDQIMLETGTSKPIDSAEIKPDGSFIMIADITGEDLFYLRTNTQNYPFGSMVSDGNKIKITGDLAKGQQSLFYGGSPATDALKNFFLTNNTYLRGYDSLSKVMDSAGKAGAADSVMLGIRSNMESLIKSLKKDVDALVKSSTSPVVQVLALQFNQNFFSPEEYGVVLKAITDKYPKDANVMAANKRYNDLIAAMNRPNQQPQQGALFTGRPAPEISLKDMNGNAVTLSSYKGKYVLVDFWASWCGPCRQENPNVVAAYNKYKAKNFTVLGVSVDENQSAWKKAVEKDKLTWTQLIDEKGVAANTYQVTGIPFNVLVNPEGVVIAENLRGSMLESKLIEVLK